MEPPKRTRLSDGINFDYSQVDALPENIEMKKILSCLSELSSANENSMRTTELLQVYRSSNLDGDSKCFSPEAIHAMAEHQEKLRGLLGLVSSKLKLILPFQNQILSHTGGMGNSTQHMNTFFMSPSSLVEPAHTWNTSAEALDAISPAVNITPTLKTVKTTKKKNRQRERKNKKPQTPLHVVNAENDGKVPEDGFLWRKYGSKNIKMAAFKKSYYRCNHPCSHSTAKKCTAKKTVQQKDDDPHLLQVAYEGSHSCKAALEFQRGSSTEDPDKAESLNLDDQMSSRANARHNPDPASEWSHIVNPVRTSSGSFSAVSEDGNDQSEEGDGNNSSVSRKDGLGNVHALPEFDIELDIDPIQDWPDCPDFKMFQGTRSYVDQTDIIEDHAKVLLENIMRPCSPGFQFGAIETLNDIQNWHGHYR
ncbi:protein MpWRKY8 [Marchantia polymorpha subsp. ruderalis]|uniref:WRKY domain-containing protein n=3 Tax=Marchantia polymorpha TaxID=3197 RepID=A0A176W7X3_MARPO|nr:hypothetical protein AXG93_1736s1000 [Marchantia polymorpha subsp. ruderalis]PTQ40445.1 hypothetical protein MARPO_0040s0116 [Marchantia polymorpha]BBN03127.1 hypothetical protein Mp_2g20960 [Marchantia polymorpha subsp. ruderalis]|eukprot:PTQ40445.1 hypothetical protein MARPO_0040s0116 [Marchantia polymorpha]